MINTYKTISIIYGGSGKDCAKLIHDRIEKLHTQEFLPVKSSILADDILPSSSILNAVREKISESSACVIILTFDDVNNTRIRQNVLIEIGIALSRISEDLCFFLCERKSLPEDFPSDIKGVVNPNYFDKENIHEEVEKICKEITRHLSLKSYSGILHDQRYEYDYRKVLDDIPVTVFDESADVQMASILSEWEKNIRSFDYVSEKIMYLAERLKFFPDFNNNEQFFAFLNNVIQQIVPSDKDYALYESEYLRRICELINAILQYSRLKLDKNVLKHMDYPDKYGEEIRSYMYEFKEIADDLKIIVDLIENDESFQINWLLKVLAYEYTGLSYMKYIACRNKYDESDLELLDFNEKCYLKMMAIGKQDILSNILWKGYAQYDLTRVYENKYRIKKDSDYIDVMMDYSNKSIRTRRKWFLDNKFKGIFSSAISFEYFLVCKFEYELRHLHEAYTDDSSEQIITGLSQLKQELNEFCENTEFGRLYEMRDSIDSLINRVKE